MMDQRNLLIALVLSLAIITGFYYFYTLPQLERQKAAQLRTTEQQTSGEMTPERPAAPGSSATTATPQPAVPTAVPAAPRQTAAQVAAANRLATIEGTPRVRIETPRLNGSVSLVGGRLDDLTLVDYRETIDPASPEIRLLAPAGAAGAYFVELGWVSDDESVTLPGPDTLWQADGKVLRPEVPITLRWDNGEGLVFKRILSIDENYMFSFAQRVENRGTKPVNLFPYGLVSRWGTPKTAGFYILHEGPLGVINDRLKEYNYSDLRDDGTIAKDSDGGWVGITDKYWLVALVPERGEAIKARFNWRDDQGLDKYQVDYIGTAPRTLAPGASLEVASDLFAGAKEVSLLDAYATDLDIEKLDRAVVFRWLYFMAKPMFHVLVYFKGLLGNFGLAILALTVLIKLLFFPLANKSYRAMGRMKRLAPKMKELRERYKDDKQKLNQEMMALYKRDKINPMAGCWPMLIQIPVFFTLYEVLFVTIEMRHAPFYGWIKDLSVRDPTSFVNLFGLLPFQPPDQLMIGVWPLIMGISMFLMQRLNPPPADAMQAKIFMFLPIVFTFILARFPSGLVIYWAWNNILSLAQQWVIMRRAANEAKT